MGHDGQKPFRVLVVGGGVAGLTMSHCLSRAGIDHVVLEAYPEIVSAKGASIGFWPHGMKILSQIGCWEDIQERCLPMQYSYNRLPSGKPFTATRLWDMIQSRHGFEFRAMERRLALEILYKNLPDKSKVLAGKRVVSVIETEQGVRVNFKDGGFEEGDIAVGCDGAHSIVRDAMWEMAGKISPGLITASEKRSMKIEYTCLIGTTSGVPGLDHSPDMHVTSGHGHTIQIVTQPNAAYFLLYQKLPQPLLGSSRNSYNQDDADRAAAKFADTPVTENVLFGEVYRKRSRSQLVDLEEVVFDHWHHGRLAILGDAAHKVTPNFAFGGNCAIEGVAALANALHKALHASPDGQLDQPAISAALAEYEARQKPRVKKIFDMCYYATRMQAWDGLLMHFISRVVVPLLGDERVADQTAKLVKGGVRLDYLPVPEHPSGSCAWDDEVMEAEGDGGKLGAVGSVALWQSLVTKGGVPALYLSLLLAGVIMSAGIRYTPLLITAVST